MSPLRHGRLGRQLTVWVPVAVAVGAAVWIGLLALAPEDAPPIVVAAVPVVAAILTWAVEQPFEQAKKRREDEDRRAEDARQKREVEAAQAETRRTELDRRQARVPTGPASLLSPARRMVPFLGRDGELADLVGWCTTTDPRHPSDVRYRLITAAGGVGKSRLAVELTDALARLPLDVGPRWQHVSVGREQEAGFVAHAREAYPGRRLLVVVDYADARPDLRVLLEEALDTEGTVRVLMLARTAGAWWSKLTDVPGDLGALLAPAWAGTDLADVNVPAQALLDAAARSFAETLDLPVPAVGVTGEQSARALDLTAAGLVAVLRQDGPESGATPQIISVAEVLDELLRREAGHWETTTQAAALTSLTGPMREVVLAAVALLGADNQEQATELALRVTKTFAGLVPSGDLPDAERVAFWLKSAYPSTDPDRWVAPLQPDRLAEHLVVTTLHHGHGPTARRRQTALLENLTSAQAVSAMTVLARAVTDPARHDHHAVVRDLADHLTTHLAADATTLDSVADAIPYPSARMTPTSLLLAQRQVDLVRSHPENEPDLAAALNNLGVLFAELGRPGDALSPSQEAVALRRRLAEASPDWYEPYLAGSLDNLGVLFGELGRPWDALPPAQEAVAAYRRLAEVSPDRYEPYLAASLHNLGNRFADLGRPRDGLPPAQEAVAAYRRLAEVSPDRYEPYLAASLDNLGVLFGELGRPGDALSPSQEAVALRRRLAEVSPDQYEPDLATSLNNLGNRFAALGRPGDALSPSQEAVALRRRLAEVSPDRYEPYLASSLDNLGSRFAALGRPGDALSPSQEAVALRRRLAEVSPDRYEPDLARSLWGLGRHFEGIGRRSGAIELLRESATVYERVVHRNGARYRDESKRLLTLLRRLEGDSDTT